MAVSYRIPLLPDNVPFSIQLAGISLTLAAIYYVSSIWLADRPYPGIPVMSLTEEEGLSPKQSWLQRGRKLIDKGMRTTEDPFQVMSGLGPLIVLPNRYADELKSLPTVSFWSALQRQLFSTYPGFEAFTTPIHEDFLPQVLRTKLTQSLGLVTGSLVDETTAAMHDGFGEDPIWNQIVIKDHILQLVARLSSRVFLGEELCRNERWLDIAKNYTVLVFTAARKLRQISPLFRRIAYEFLPEVYRDACVLITPEIERRKIRAQKALDAGLKPPKVGDTIGWMYELAKEQRLSTNYVPAQLMLTVAAIHTTTELLTTGLHKLVAHPEFIEPLRAEVIAVIGDQGWSKTALYKLKLMDSFLKELQRHVPASPVSMNRYVLKKTTLSDGMILPAGASVTVAGEFLNAAVYDRPDVFDPYRFYRKREEPGHANSWQLVTVLPEHFAFGYGKHACPGRFFASNELKIALAHLLLKYDWKLVEDGQSPVKIFEATVVVNPTAKIEVKRRQEEIDLDKCRNED